MNKISSKKSILNRDKYRSSSLTEVSDDAPYTDKQITKFISDIEAISDLKDDIYTGDVSQMAVKLATISDFIKYDLKTNQSDDSDSFIIKRDTKSIKDLAKDFTDIVSDISVLQQRLEVTLDDMINIISKYYTLKSDEDTSGDSEDGVSSDVELDKKINAEINEIRKTVFNNNNKNKYK